MAIDVIGLLTKLNRDHINKTVLVHHDVARASFHLPKIIVDDFREFNYIVTTYIQHHHRQVGEGELSTGAAFGEAKRLLKGAFKKDPFQEGYAAALQIARDGTMGGMRMILNELAESIKNRAYHDYLDTVFHHYVDVLSKKDNLDLARAFFAHFQPTLQRFGYEFDEYSFVNDTRAAVEYYLGIIQEIIKVAKKI